MAMDPPFAPYRIYKWKKTIFDFKRAHDCMLRYLVGEDHLGLKASADGREYVKYAIDDLLASFIGAWDAYTEELLAQNSIPTNGKLTNRLANLQQLNHDAWHRHQAAWNKLVSDINTLRNEYHHEDYWKNHFGVGQGNGLFQVDLVAEKDQPGGNKIQIYVFRDVRRGARTLSALCAAARIDLDPQKFPNPCAGCYEDEWSPTTLF